MRIRKRLLAGIGAGLLAAAAAIAVPGTAQGATLPTDWTRVVNKNSGKCVDARAAATANGTVVQQYACNGTNAQLWRFTPTSDGYYRVEARNASSQVWDVADVSNADGGKIQLWGYGGGGNQQWKPVEEAGGTWRFVARHSGKCLDVPAASRSDSVQFQQYNCNGTGAQSFTVGGTGGTDPGPGGFKQAAPYLYLGWGDPPSATSVMSDTGIKWFTMAFILSSGGCNPAWDGQRALTGGTDQSTINAIRNAGGDIVPSIGGWSGNKLGPNCSTPEALAGAYQKVIDAYNLKVIDVDIENTDEFENATVQDRILTALKIVKQNNPGLKTILTFGTSTSGPGWWGNRLIEQASALQADIDVFTIMPFDFGGGADMYGNTVNATEGLKAKLKSTFGWSDATAYAHIGISGMNGLSDQQELTSPETWTKIRDWANSQRIARLSFWSVNRDRPCPNGGVTSNCSGIDQSNWQFTKITAGFTG
ncbi:RICIN domain-containing protein [Streptomyces sp. KR80]|uniref:RICIN domain-containing protein n=1 Tax=Streptomyces sp. KR80 TaxID=3457426 RepID=UPI003FD05823